MNAAHVQKMLSSKFFTKNFQRLDMSVGCIKMKESKKERTKKKEVVKQEKTKKKMARKKKFSCRHKMIGMN